MAQLYSDNRETIRMGNVFTSAEYVHRVVAVSGTRLVMVDKHLDAIRFCTFRKNYRQSGSFFLSLHHHPDNLVIFDGDMYISVQSPPIEFRLKESQLFTNNLSFSPNCCQIMTICGSYLGVEGTSVLSFLKSCKMTCWAVIETEDGVMLRSMSTDQYISQSIDDWGRCVLTEKQHDAATFKVGMGMRGYDTYSFRSKHKGQYLCHFHRETAVIYRHVGLKSIHDIGEEHLCKGLSFIIIKYIY
ncbi:developmentally-regulated protein [Acrasis kona]|uniref:Developmentally-regulated protein n=1 Tax=Acrasis kona TaxID=1008807 RepID=A0AAW2YUG1_9EUKA